MIGATSGASGLSNPFSMSGMQGMKPPKAMEARLDAALQSSGLSSEKITSLKKDLQGALESAFQNGSVSGPQDLQETVKGVFESYGLNADELASKFGPPPGMFGGGGMMGVGQSVDTSTDQLLRLLGDSLGKSDEKQGRSYQQISQELVDSLIGVDVSA